MNKPNQHPCGADEIRECDRAIICEYSDDCSAGRWAAGFGYIADLPPLPSRAENFELDSITGAGFFRPAAR